MGLTSFYHSFLTRQHIHRTLSISSVWAAYLVGLYFGGRYAHRTARRLKLDITVDDTLNLLDYGVRVIIELACFTSSSMAQDTIFNIPWIFFCVLAGRRAFGGLVGAVVGVHLRAA